LTLQTAYQTVSNLGHIKMGSVITARLKYLLILGIYWNLSTYKEILEKSLYKECDKNVLQQHLICPE